MRLIPCMDLEAISGIKGEKRKCSLCGKQVKAGYSPQYNTDEEYKILERNLSGELENWFVCEDCVGGHCQEPDIWLAIIQQKRGRK